MHGTYCRPISIYLVTLDFHVMTSHIHNYKWLSYVNTSEMTCMLKLIYLCLHPLGFTLVLTLNKENESIFTKVMLGKCQTDVSILCKQRGKLLLEFWFDCSHSERMITNWIQYIWSEYKSNTDPFWEKKCF